MNILAVNDIGTLYGCLLVKEVEDKIKFDFVSIKNLDKIKDVYKNNNCDMLLMDGTGMYLTYYDMLKKETDFNVVKMKLNTYFINELFFISNRVIHRFKDKCIRNMSYEKICDTMNNINEKVSNSKTTNISELTQNNEERDIFLCFSYYSFAVRDKK